MMKKLIFLSVFITCSLLTKGQTDVNLNWETDMNVSISQSMSTGKPILLFFTGSDWCGWCIRLQKEVFKTAEFSKWANENVILMEVDFPRTKVLNEKLRQQNAQLQTSFGVRGYPTVFIVSPTSDENGKVSLNTLHKTGYEQGGPTSWINNANVNLKK
jgi:thioredoxin-related protein